MTFTEGQAVRVHHTDALGRRTEYAGKIVRFEQNVKMWRVDIGGIAITFEEGDIHAIEPGDAQVQDGQAAQRIETGTQG